ncbi:MAG: ankyrin repeat domain-containing protein [Flavobacteriales bacterium]
MEQIFEELLRSLYQKNMEVFKKKLNLLKDIDYIDKDGRTLLMYAVLNEDNNFIIEILKRNPDVNRLDHVGKSASHYSISVHNLEILKNLIKAGGNINETDNNGNTLINDAVFISKGRGEIIEFLLKNGADPKIENDYGVSAIDLAKTIANYNIEQFFNT